MKKTKNFILNSAKLVCICLLLTLSFPAFCFPAKAAESETLGYLSLGDSITWGDKLAAPQSEAFPYLLSEELGLDLSNKSIIGNTAVGILRQINNPSHYLHVSSDDIRAADVISITCGGNDLMDALYAEVMRVWNKANPDDTLTLYEVFERLERNDVNIILSCLKILDEDNEDYIVKESVTDSETGLTVPSPLKQKIDEFISGLEKITSHVHSINPNARILVATQYNPYVEFKNKKLSVSIMRVDIDPIYRGMEDGITWLNSEISSHADEFGYEVVDVKSAFDSYTGDKDLYNADPQMATLNVDFHPTAAGQRLLADTFKAHLSEPIPILAASNGTLGTVSGQNNYSLGEKVTLRAAATVGASFAYWVDTEKLSSSPASEAELRNAIVSYDPELTFLASRKASYKAIFAENRTVSMYAYVIGSAERPNGASPLGEKLFDTGIKLMGNELRFGADDVTKTLEINGKRYEFAGFIIRDTSGNKDILSQSVSIPAQPLPESSEWQLWLTSLGDIRAAYVEHIHNYGELRSDVDGHWALCLCGASSAPEKHSFDLQSGLCKVCGHQAAVSTTAPVTTKPDTTEPDVSSDITSAIINSSNTNDGSETTAEAKPQNNGCKSSVGLFPILLSLIFLPFFRRKAKKEL